MTLYLVYAWDISGIFLAYHSWQDRLILGGVLMLDLLLEGGTVIDGTGNPGYRASVGVEADKTVLVGAGAASAKRVIDARGLMVVPRINHVGGGLGGSLILNCQCVGRQLTLPASWCGRKALDSTLGMRGSTESPREKNVGHESG